ncbi:UNVERIFIED_CONTAM: hypothetical protein FKN15_030537 [Acipenser sinensis]
MNPRIPLNTPGAPDSFTCRLYLLHANHNIVLFVEIAFFRTSQLFKNEQALIFEPCTLMTGQHGAGL